MPRYAFSIDVEAEAEPMDVPVLCRDCDSARQRAGELLSKYPPFQRISIWRNGRLVCQMERPALS